MIKIYQPIKQQTGTDNAPSTMGVSAAFWVAENTNWLIPRHWLHIRVKPRVNYFRKIPRVQRLIVF